MPKICAQSETLFVRKHCVRCLVAFGNLRSQEGGEALRRRKETLLTGFEVVAYGALLLLLPCALGGLIFDWILTELLVQVMLVAVGGTAVLTAIAIHEGWYFDHVSGWGLTDQRVEPSVSAKPPAAAAEAAHGGEAR